MQSAPILFNRDRLRKRRERAAPNFTQHDFLWHEAAARAEETLGYITRRFPRVAVFGGHAMQPPSGCEEWIAADGIDEEHLPFAPEHFDAILCLLNLHWVNDLPGTLIQLRRALKPDGLFFAIMPGAETLRELRDVFATIETQRSGGIRPRVAPFLDVREAGSLLQRAGFALPVVDSESLTISYSTMDGLMADLRGSGQVNMLHSQVQHFTPRGFFADAAKCYAERYGDAQGRLPATVEFLTLTGWSPAANQQQPLKPGSGQLSLTELFPQA